MNLAVVPDCGEDSFAFHRDEGNGFLCVADGCGGLGGKRYGRLGERTGAYLASRLAADCMGRWAAEGLIPFPRTREEGRLLAETLTARLGATMRRFETENADEGSRRIVGSMQRSLPTTLCFCQFRQAPQGMLDCLFLWAGDSRGYLLDAQGLHQLTADHTVNAADALHSLYRDAPLRNLISADAPFALSVRRIRAEGPCLVIAATDGAFAYLPTPMEFEWVLLSTLKNALSQASWQRKLTGEMRKIASDDCTMLMAMAGYEDFKALKDSLENRCIALQREYITPVRRHRQRLDYAEGRWETYRLGYDWTEGNENDDLDWRV